MKVTPSKLPAVEPDRHRARRNRLVGVCRGPSRADRPTRAPARPKSAASSSYQALSKMHGVTTKQYAKAGSCENGEPDVVVLAGNWYLSMAAERAHLALALALKDAVVEFVDHAVMSVGKHPKRVANDAGNHEVARRADAICFENGGETVPDMVVDATIYNLDTVPPGCLCQIDNCLGQQKIIAVTHRFPELLPARYQISSASASRNR